MSELFTGQLEDETIATRFSDFAWIDALVRVEVALVRAQAGSGVIPTAAADTIAHRAGTFSPDIARLASAVTRDGFPVIGLLEQLRAHVGGDAAGFVHWGATTQDILDTALVTQLGAVLRIIEHYLATASGTFARLAETHRATLMIGRTHLQPAVPITFGLKAAGWLAPLVRHRSRLAELRARALVVQCGGAAGTLASYGAKGDAVARAWAAELGLSVPAMPWHAQRDTVQEVAGWLALVGDSVAKFAGDVLLLAQAEVGEVRESSGAGEGGSSAMPQKSNPVRSEAILVGVRLLATHHAGVVSAPPPEHERGTQTWQIEAAHLPRMCALTGGLLRAAERLATDLVVDQARMRANLNATYGVLLAEACALSLARHLERDAARALVREAARQAIAEQRHLLEILRARPEVGPVLNELPKDEADYLGSSGLFIDRVLAEAAALPAILRI